VIRSGPASCVLLALDEILGYLSIAKSGIAHSERYVTATLHPEEIESILENWASLVRAAKEVDSALRTVFELLRVAPRTPARTAQREAILQACLSHPKSDYRYAAVCALEEEASPEVVEMLEALLEDRDDFVAQGALRAFIKVRSAREHKT